MLTKKRLPERFEIFCCCLLVYCIFLYVFLFVFLCEYNFMCWKIYIARERETREEFIFIIHHFAVRSRARPRKKKLLRFSLCHLKSHFGFVLYALEERYIVTAASDIYFCKHPHNVVALLYDLLFEMLEHFCRFFSPFLLRTAKKRQRK